MSDSLDKLAEALAAAQGAFTNPPKDRENPYFKSRYATLDSMQNVTRGPLSKNGLSITQGGARGPDGTWELETTLRHSSGGSVSSRLPLLSFAKGPQAAGSELTYMRRYAYAAILNITADEDDDANSAQNTPAAQSAPTGRHYDVKPQGTSIAPAQAPAVDDAELGKAVGQVGKINPSADGKCWFLSIGSLGTAKGESLWCRDKELVDSLNVGMDVIATVRSKKAGSYQLVSFVKSNSIDDEE
jgi:hypothetical protein